MSDAGTLPTALAKPDEGSGRCGAVLAFGCFGTVLAVVALGPWLLGRASGIGVPLAFRASLVAACGSTTWTDPAHVSALALSRDGRRIVSGSYDGTVLVRDLETGAELATVDVKARVLAARLEEGSRERLFVVSARGLALVDVASGRIEKELVAESYCAALLPDHSALVHGRDGVAVLDLDAAKGSVRREPSSYALSATPDGALVAWSRTDSGVTVRERATWRDANLAPLSTSSIMSLALQQDGRALLQGTIDGRLSLRDAVTGFVTADWSLGSWARAIAFTRDGASAYVLSGRQLLRVALDGRTPPAPVTEVNGQALVLGARDEAIVADDNRLHVVSLSGERRNGIPGTVRNLVLSPDGRCALAGFEDGTIRSVAPETLALGPTIPAHARAVQALCWSASGALVASSGRDGPVRVWETASLLRGGVPLPLVEARLKDPPSRLAFLAGDRGLVGQYWTRLETWELPALRAVPAASGSRGGFLDLGPDRALAWEESTGFRVHDAETGAVLTHLATDERTTGVREARLLPGGRFAALEYDNVCAIWDPASPDRSTPRGAIVTDLGNETGSLVASDREGQRILIGRANHLVLCETASGREVARIDLPEPGWPTSAVFVPAANGAGRGALLVGTNRGRILRFELENLPASSGE